MKKLMFGAALAATGMAFAATPAAQVYDVNFSIKTTKAAAAKVNDKTNPVATPESYGSDGKLYYRTQTTVTWKGLIWGCNCEGINGVWEKVVPCTLVWDKDLKEYVEVEDPVTANTVKGCVVWDVKGKSPVYLGEDVNVSLDKIDVTGNPGWGWQMLQLIEKNGASAEAVWTIAGLKDLCDEDQPTFQFAGAGFGTVNFVKSGDEIQCNSYVKKLAGNFAGVMRAPTTDMVTQQGAGCSFCGGVIEQTECIYIDPWAWCEFGSLCGCEIGIELQPEFTAAYGTWTITYNSSLSKKLSDATSILDVYNFKSLPEVAAAIEIAEAQILGYRPEGCDELEEALNKATKSLSDAQDVADKAKTAFDEALANQEAVSTENLYIALTNANAELIAASNALSIAWSSNYVAWVEYNTASNKHAEADKACGKQWSFKWENASGDTYTVKGTNAWTLVDKMNEVYPAFTITKVIYGDKTIGENDGKYDVPNPPTPPVTTTDPSEAYNEAMAHLNKWIAEHDAAKADEQAKYAVLEDARKFRKAAQEVVAEKETAARTAYYRFQDRVSLQLLAQQQVEYRATKLGDAKEDLEKAQKVYDLAKKAYDDNGCN